QQRILATQDHHLHRLAALKVLVAVDTSVLALGDLAADRLAVIDLGAIGAEVEPALIRIPGDDAICGADEARLVELMMPRYREFEHIDGGIPNDIFEDRSVFDFARWQRPEVAHTLMIALHNINLAVMFERQSQREGNASNR